MSDQLRLPGIPDAYLGAAPPALCAPCIKYAGGKSWVVSLILPRIHALLAGGSGTYVEPFFGGGAMGLALGWPRSILADKSEDLVNLYRSIATDPDQVADAIDALAAGGTGEDAYYAVRRSIWPDARSRLSQFEWAARVIYLNKAGFNGLWRVNRRGEYNVPWGGRESAAMPSRDHLRAISRILAPTDLRACDFGDVLLEVERRCDDPEWARGCVVFLDPPYGATVPDATTRGAKMREGGVFDGYTIGGFPWGEGREAEDRDLAQGRAPRQRGQVWLAETAGKIAGKGACVVATNAWADPVVGLYRDFCEVFPVGVRHSVGADGSRRGRRMEMLAVSCAHAGIFDASGSDVAVSRG